MSPREGAAVNSEDPPTPEKTPFIGSCRDALQCAGMLSWGPGKRTPIFRRQRDMQPFLCFLEKEEPDLDGDDDKRAVKRPNVAPASKVSKKRKEARQDSKDRWSKERYLSAELKLMDIMDAKGAVLGNPILRPELRAEARKHIGDTGLLDHLLKHMAGKVVPQKDVRFRRRHNPEGAMEYWLEPADLMDLRKKAGVQDPYWSPPPGWKPSDGPIMDAACAKEMKKLREEVAIIKRDLEGLLGKRQESEEDSSVLTPASAAAKDTLLGSDISGALQERYSSLLKGKCMLEEQLSEISKSLEGMQAEVQKLGGEVEGAKKKAEANKAGRSGFKRCKPEGTFVNVPPGDGWNSMSQLQAEDFLMVPTPPSASSSTSAPPLPWPPLQPTSPVKPQPKILPARTSPVKPQPKILPTMYIPQADGRKRKLWDYCRSSSMISCPAACAASGSLPPASAHPDTLLHSAPSHPGESVCLRESDAVVCCAGRTVISANPPHPAPAAAVTSSRSWLSL